MSLPFTARLACAGLALLALAAMRAEAADRLPNELRSARASLGSAIVAIASELVAEGPATTLRVTLSSPVEARAFVMERPDRVIVDLPEVNFQLGAEAGQRREGLVTAYRYGLFAPGRSRLVIDLAQPARVARLDVAPRAQDGATVLTLELARSDRETFRKAAADTAQPAPVPPVSRSDARADQHPVIVIDPGHGGIDPGAKAVAGVHEKDLVFAFAQVLRTKLESTKRYRVLMTREQDVFVSLDERVRFARNAGADLLISVHADSIASAQVRGATVYTGAPQASDAESARLAERENEADAVAGLDASDGADDVADILQDLTMRETRGFSRRFASRLVGELEPVMRLNTNPHRQAGFRVLRASDVPSVLVELGYLSSRKDTDLIMSEEWRAKSAGAMTAAIDRFFSTRIANQGRGAPAPVP